MMWNVDQKYGWIQFSLKIRENKLQIRTKYLPQVHEKVARNQTEKTNGKCVLRVSRKAKSESRF